MELVSLVARLKLNLFTIYFRTVYDSDGHKMFMQKLDESITQHDKEIEKMCNFHYQGFIESVNELLNVKGDTHKLKVHILFLSLLSLAVHHH